MAVSKLGHRYNIISNILLSSRLFQWSQYKNKKGGIFDRIKLSSLIEPNLYQASVLIMLDRIDIFGNEACDILWI